MINKKVIPIVIIALVTGFFAAELRPFNYAEKNLGTVYYQSYQQFYITLERFVREYSINQNNEQVDNAISHFRVFQIGLNSDYRKFAIGSKVIKDDALINNSKDIEQMLNRLKTNEFDEQIKDELKDLVIVLKPKEIGKQIDKDIYTVLIEGSEEKLVDVLSRLDRLLK